MVTTRRITFRLYPNKSAVSKLHYARKAHCDLYNAALSNRKVQYQRFGNSVSYFDQQNSLPAFKEELPEYKEFGSHSLQATLKRVDFAFQRFFKGLAKYPKFKAKRKYRGWTYPCRSGWKAHTEGKHGYLELKDLGLKIRMRGQARTWGKPTTCTIVWDGQNWYASITVKCEPVRETGTGAIGLDFGCKSAIAGSNGDFIEAPKFQTRAKTKENRLNKKLRRKRRPEKRKVKASRRWKKYQKQISKVKRKVANQRHDWSHQVASQIVSSNSLVATEQLNLKGMTRKAKAKGKRQKTGLNRSMLDVAIGMTKDNLKYKVEEAGGIYSEAPTRTLKPTQRCAKCWEITKKTLSDRVHHCQHCDHQEDRDINAAQVMLEWARGQELSSSDVELPTSVDCGSMGKVGAKKRQKPQAQT
ncbi:RNA-guided endonuclease TnpB family protein [Halothece sp. PCC 7418]|uniref:RNA-guided endonuclease InsQ/TnpB family protein n=1 Tax=Halothece sp. (strain PCC 7418) TaxID=65093 RepID=UPI0005A0C3AE|nr:RNA-guided endonuclease TnpB family protein [Halothece sp. PCC 7418]